MTYGGSDRDIDDNIDGNHWKGDGNVSDDNNDDSDGNHWKVMANVSDGNIDIIDNDHWKDDGSGDGWLWEV